MIELVMSGMCKNCDKADLVLRQYANREYAVECTYWKICERVWKMKEEKSGAQ